MLRVFFVLASLSALAGCASSSSDDDAATAKTTAQAQALQKAKDVQKTIDAGDARNRKAIDDAEKDKDDGGG